jgi:hypothetical protein
MEGVRECGSKGGSLQSLTLKDCDFGDEVVDFGSCVSLTHLTVSECSSSLITTPGDSLGCMRLLWGILHTCKNLKRFEFYTISCVLYDRDLCLLARFCPDLEYLHLKDIFSTSESITVAACLCVVGKCSKLQHLSLELWLGGGGVSDHLILAVAANLLSLRSLTIRNLQLQNPHTLRCLVGCPQLQNLRIGEGNVSEAELLYLVEHANNLQTLTIGDCENLDIRQKRKELLPYDYDPQQLLHLGIDDPQGIEVFISAQRKKLQIMRSTSQQIWT